MCDLYYTKEMLDDCIFKNNVSYDCRDILEIEMTSCTFDNNFVYNSNDLPELDLKEIFFLDEEEKPKVPHKCHCSRDQVVFYGCLCGGV